MDNKPHVEVVPFGRVVWQSDKAKTYLCPHCKANIRSQYEGEQSPFVECNGSMSAHVLTWPAACGQPCQQHDDCDRPCVRSQEHDGRCECKNHAG